MFFSYNRKEFTPTTKIVAVTTELWGYPDLSGRTNKNNVSSPSFFLLFIVETGWT